METLLKMQKPLQELREDENMIEIQKTLLELFKTKQGYGITFDDIEFFLIQARNLGLELGGKLLLNNLLQTSVKEGIFKKTISHGKELYYIE